MRILVIDLLDNVWILQREVTFKSFLVDKELKDYTIVDYYYKSI